MATLKELDEQFPSFKVRVRKDIKERLWAKGGKKLIKQIFEDWYNKDIAKEQIELRRAHHSAQFAKMGVQR